MRSYSIELIPRESYTGSETWQILVRRIYGILSSPSIKVSQEKTLVNFICRLLIFSS